MGLVDAIRHFVRAPAFKFIIIIVLILALSIPLLFVYLMVTERARYAATARADVARSWANQQLVRGPFVIVPTLRDRTIRARNETRTEQVREFAIFLPEQLTVKPNVKTEVRRRGIFDVPVYRSQIEFEGRFDPPEMRRLAQPGLEILWREAVVTLFLSDVRGIKKTAAITLGGQATRLRSGPGVETRGSGRNRTGAVHVPVTEAIAKAGFPFKFQLELNGSTALNFVPAGGETEVRMRSDWPHPSFQGQFLPDTRAITDSGFEAAWKIPRLARGQGQTLHVKEPTGVMNTTQFGVNFFQPVKFYSLAERALKYAQGFVAIIFFAVFVLEMQSRRRVHWIQYLFVGLSLVVFYLVLIGTAEHIGFEGGYLAAAASTSLLVGAYIATVTKSAAKGGQIFGVIALIYGLLYLLLRVEDYAMLIGSLSAFALLATVMFATRNVDWSRGSAVEYDDEAMPPPSQ